MKRGFGFRKQRVEQGARRVRRQGDLLSAQR
jgi:hypothetical protein